MLAEAALADLERAVGKHEYVGVRIPPLTGYVDRELTELANAVKQVACDLNTLLSATFEHVHNLRFDSQVLDGLPVAGLIAAPLATAESVVGIKLEPPIAEFVMPQSTVGSPSLTLLRHAFLPRLPSANHGEHHDYPRTPSTPS